MSDMERKVLASFVPGLLKIEAFATSEVARVAEKLSCIQQTASKVRRLIDRIEGRA